MNNINKSLITMEDMLYDPTLVQEETLTMLENASNGKLNIPDPNNPFVYLMETNVLPMTAALTDIVHTLRGIHPILANTPEELYPHLVDSDLTDMYATPSKAMFTFYINKQQIISNGYKGTNSTEITIPKKTTITVNNIEFTILNNINITLFSNNSVFVKIIGNNDSSAIPNDILVPAGIITDENKVDWVIFEVEILQLRLIHLNDSIIKSNKYSKDILISKQFSHIELSTLINGSPSKVEISYSNYAYSRDVPIAYVKKLTGKINIEIPYYFIVNNLIANNLDINIFTTEGNIVEPITKYSPSDITIKFNIANSQDPRITSVNNLSIFIKANTYTYGGRDEIDFLTLKNKVINNTTGDNIIPITQYDIKEKLSTNGFKLKYSNDSLFKREYITYKYLESKANVNVQLDVLMDVIQIDSTNIDNKYIVNIGNSIIINPFTVVEYSNNKLNILNKDTIDKLTTFTKDKLNKYVNNKRLFYNIYKYILDYDENIACRIYDVNTPKIEYVKDNIINSHIDTKITIVSRNVKRIGNIYTIELTMIADDIFKNMNLLNIKCQLGLIYKDIKHYIYFNGSITEDSGNYLIKIDIDTTGYIDKDNRLQVINYVGDVNLASIDLNSIGDIIIYTTDTMFANDKTYIIDEVYDNTAVCDIYKETFNLITGVKIEYLYDNYTVDYTNRKYKKYEQEVLLTYTENVYEMDSDGVVVDYVDTTGDGKKDTAVPKLLHKKGTNVLDTNGDVIVLHHKGDVILDSDNTPIIDTKYGLIHNIDVLLLEYENKLVTNTTYKDYLISSYKQLTTITTTELGDINNKLLDNTIIKYKPLTILENINLIVNNIVYNTPNFINPIITVYVKTAITDSKVYTLLRNILSKILQQGLRDEIPMSDIINNMLAYKDIPMLSITISNIDNINNPNIKVYANNSSRFIIDKKLILDSTGNTDIAFNTTLNILTI